MESQIKWTTFLDVHDANLSESHKRWRRLLDVYLVASGVTEESRERHFATILYCAGNDMILASEHFLWKKEDGTNMTDAQRKDPINLLTQIASYCNPRQSVVLMSFRFWNTPWSSPFDTFLTELRSRANACDFKEKDRMIRDKLVFSAKGKVQELLLRDAELDLTRAIKTCRDFEQSAQQIKEMNNPNSIEKVDKFKFEETSTYKPNETEMLRDCRFCGGSHLKNKKKCPAFGKQCNNCNGYNHWAVKCRKPKVNSVDNETTDTQPQRDSKWLSAVRSNKDGRAYALMKVNDCSVKFMLDPGATVNCIGAQYVHRSQLSKSQSSLYMWNNVKQPCLGEVDLLLTNPKNNHQYRVHFSVVDNNFQCILDMETCKMMGLVTFHENLFCVASLSEVDDLGDLGEATLVVDESIPAKVLPSRKIPIALENDVIKSIKDLVDRKILIPVEKPTKWVSQMAAVRKPNGDIRICIDPQPLNVALQREHYRLPTFDDVLPKLLNAKVFSKVDVKEAFWHIKLDEYSSILTTMITPIGRFRWARLPFGLKVSSEIFQKRLHQALSDLDGVICVADDIVVFGSGNNEEEAEKNHEENLKQLLARCSKAKIKLNKAKMHLKQDEIEFLGHKLSKEGVRASEEKVRAIQEMPAPEDVSGVRRLCGMVQYLARFTPHLADYLHPIHHLTCKEVSFEWSAQCQESFEQLKEKLSNSPVLTFYDPEKPLVLQVDSSEKGLGAVLLQDGKPVEYASRNLRSNERGWSQLEKETLAVVYGLEKFDQYTYGRKVIVHNDHKPLEIILAKPISQATKRVQALMMRIFRYDYEFIWMKGEKLYLADTLSRAYLEIQGDGPDPRICSFESFKLPDERMKEIQIATTNDELSQVIMKNILLGWPESRDKVCEEAKTYFDIRDTLAVSDGVIYKGERVVIPEKLRSDIKRRLHASHLGTESMMRRARETVYWPGMVREVEQMAASCKPCLEYKPANPKEPLIIHDKTNKPWDKIGCDLFQLENKDFLIVVDYHSNFIEVEFMKTTSSKNVVNSIEKMCARFGRPKEMITDGGPQFVSHEFRQFTAEWKICHNIASPYHQQSNGKAEAAVKTVKNMMRKCLQEGSNMYLALLELRSTPRQDTPSPAQIMFGRNIDTQLPSKDHSVKFDKKSKENRQKSVEKYYNKSATDLSKLKPNQSVCWKNGGTDSKYKTCSSVVSKW